MQGVDFCRHSLRPENGCKSEEETAGESRQLGGRHSNDERIDEQHAKDGKYARHEIHPESDRPYRYHAEEFAYEGIKGIATVMGNAERKSSGRQFTAVSQINSGAGGVEVDNHGQ